MAEFGANESIFGFGASQGLGYFLGRQLCTNVSAEKCLPIVLIRLWVPPLPDINKTPCKVAEGVVTKKKLRSG